MILTNPLEGSTHTQVKGSSKGLWKSVFEYPIECFKFSDRKDGYMFWSIKLIPKEVEWLALHNTRVKWKRLMNFYQTQKYFISAIVTGLIGLSNLLRHQSKSLCALKHKCSPFFKCLEYKTMNLSYKFDPMVFIYQPDILPTWYLTYLILPICPFLLNVAY